jgi:excisionase family DNA binding protein
MSTTNFEMPNFLKVSEIAEILRVSKMTVYRLVHSGELESVRVGRCFRVTDMTVANYLKRGQESPQTTRQS